jgi:hypothetical protein
MHNDLPLNSYQDNYEPDNCLHVPVPKDVINVNEQAALDKIRTQVREGAGGGWAVHQASAAGAAAGAAAAAAGQAKQSRGLLVHRLLAMSVPRSTGSATHPHTLLPQVLKNLDNVRPVGLAMHERPPDAMSLDELQRVNLAGAGDARRGTDE